MTASPDLPWKAELSPLSARQVVEVWESADGRSVTAQALGLLAAAFPDASREALGRLPLGRRDCRLLELRTVTLGDTLEARSPCPRCGEDLELTLAASRLFDGAAATEETGVLRKDGLEVRFRVPASSDLLAAEACGDPEGARRLILERCVTGARRGGEEVTARELEPAEVEALAAALAAADPWAEVRLNLRCPACSHAWQELFDVASFLAAELHHLAGRLLREVHLLARAYCWREADVLAMSARRRQAYLEMLGR